MCHTSKHMFHGSFIKSYEILVNIQGVFHISNGKRHVLISALINYATIMYSCVILIEQVQESPNASEERVAQENHSFPFTF